MSVSHSTIKKLGSNYESGRCEFVVWAPEKEQMFLCLETPEQQILKMQKTADGYFTHAVRGIMPDTLYTYSSDGTNKIPDPASHFQPQGVHGPSQIVDHNQYHWNDSSWRGLPLKELIFYELHVGTFTPEGTFEAIVPLLDHLADLGINAIEIMPVSQFPGNRNWGYDGVFPYAVQNTYGGPQQFKAFVDTAHSKGIAVFLDVVFNHIGPEGNYFGSYAPYFNDTYCTPWGDAINFDGDWSDGVRDYFSNCILHWYEHYHLDGLRVDAVHTMYDKGAVHFWEMAQEKLDELRQRLGRSFHMVAECDLNSPKVTYSPEKGGWGFNAQWLDDFHHALYVLLDEQGRERYEDFGSMQQLAKAYTDGFVHSGEYVKFRKRKHGASSAGVSGEHFVVFNQNHDQVGNRVGGERLSMLVDFERQKLAAAAVLLSPYLPMLFMGEEFGAKTPFFYFVSHSDKKLIEMVAEGRRKEFENYKWETEPPHPQEEKTFLDSKIDWAQSKAADHQIMLNWYKQLITFRKYDPVLQNFDKNDIRVTHFGSKGLVLHRRCAEQKDELMCIFNLGPETETWLIPDQKQNWTKILDSGDAVWLPGSQTAAYQTAQTVAAGESVTVSGISVTVYKSAD
jgi:maltooligosyltrehalose trehalohydrolase